MTLPDRAPSFAHREGHARAAVRVALLLAVSVGAYLPALHGGFVGLDDETYVVNNPTLRSLAGLLQIWVEPTASPQYYPITFSTFWLQYQLWGAQPHGYHAVNVALHALDSTLIWLLLRRLDVPGALLAAVIFALHPVHVESVAWITELKDVLSTAWYLLALLAWLSFAASRDWSRYALALGLFIGAMLSKTMTCTLPATLLLLTWWKEPQRWRERVCQCSPFVVLGLALSLMTVTVERAKGTPDKVVSALTMIDRTLIAGKALWFYAWKLLWPVNLTSYYPRWEIDGSSPLQYLFLLAAVALVLGLYSSRARLGKGPVVAVAFFIFTLAPVLGLIRFNFMAISYVADHLQYLASAGLITGVAAAVATQSKHLGAAPAPVAAVGAAVLAGTLGGLTWRQAGTYEGMEAFARANIRVNPSAALPHYTLGSSFGEQGALDAALAELSEAVRLKPDYVGAHYNLGHVLELLGRNDEAILHFRAAAALAPHADALHHLGDLLRQQGDTAAALEAYGAALRIEPDKPETHAAMATLLMSQGQTEAALEHLRAAGDARMSLGVSRLAEGRVDEAVEEFADAARLQPDRAGAFNNWGIALAMQGRFAAAVVRLTEALRLDPNDADTRANLERAQRDAAAQQAGATPHQE